tara:strand:+ start:87 stop:242 length:156 start_codon:yes stop_codon:yes gene_type:complete
MSKQDVVHVAAAKAALDVFQVVALPWVAARVPFTLVVQMPAAPQFRTKRKP